MYGDVVLELKPLDRTERDPFEVILEEKKLAYGMSLDTDAQRAPPSRVKIGP